MSRGARLEMCFAGSGGQGIVLSSIILAEAAFLAGKSVAQSQCYGPEARGGLCRAELIVDERPIAYPKVARADVLLALAQASVDALAQSAAPGTLLLIDESLALPRGAATAEIVALPMLRAAAHIVGRPMTANIVAVGAINALVRIAPPELLREAVRMHVPRGTEDINLRALAEGERLGAAARI